MVRFFLNWLKMLDFFCKVWYYYGVIEDKFTLKAYFKVGCLNAFCQSFCGNLFEFGKVQKLKLCFGLG